MSWGINIHKGDVEGKVSDALDHVSRHGAKYIRLDFWWDQIRVKDEETGELRWADKPGEAIEWYHNFVNEANKTKGIKVIAVLGTGMPTWAQTLYATNKDRFWTEWEKSCKKIAEEFGKNITYYQILNEENHPAHSRLWPQDEPTAFKKAREAISQGEGLNGDGIFKTIVNVFAYGPIVEELSRITGLVGIFEPWKEKLIYWCNSEARDYIDVLAIDTYPDTWSISGDWTPLIELSTIINAYNKEGAVMETGYSTWPAREAGQPLFIKTELSIMKFIATYNNLFCNNKITLGNWYELVDEPGWAIFEKNFGILRTDWSEKMGYNTLKDIIGQY